jgi:hypothetical protein
MFDQFLRGYIALMEAYPIVGILTLIGAAALLALVTSFIEKHVLKW